MAFGNSEKAFGYLDRTANYSRGFMTFGALTIVAGGVVAARHWLSSRAEKHDANFIISQQQFEAKKTLRYNKEFDAIIAAEDFSGLDLE